jgi:predicted Zn-dependent protease
VLIRTDNEELNSEGVAEEIISDLERLHELKHNFELLFTDTPPSVTTNTTASSFNVETKSAKKEDEKVSAPKEKSGLSKKERIIALAKEADLKAEAEAKEKNIPASVGRKKKENTGDLLIDEIVSTKQEINPETEKQKEQIELINQFIQAQPSIVNREKTITVPTGDLSTIKSGEFGDNIVSETLVDILLKQGKKDKAIEVLKKLIWKFPQKKAYFAAQIEELKK